MIQFRLPIGRILLFLSFGLIFPSRGLPAREGGRERKPGLRTETWGWDVGGDRQKKKYPMIWMADWPPYVHWTQKPGGQKEGLDGGYGE
jgi:hypothetical protein